MTKFKLAPKFGFSQWDGKISNTRLSPSLVNGCRGKRCPPLCHPDPDFLRVAQSKTACAALSKESRIGFANANKLHGKSGGAKPRDLQFRLIVRLRLR
jgi:hypothetical protein